jgi:hypothetical protein
VTNCWRAAVKSRQIGKDKTAEGEAEIVGLESRYFKQSLADSEIGAFSHAAGKV